ncbi:enoyl-CoA hydratase-related protein [Rhodococcus sp. DMU1]|uniref:enoyl-CoA hydratase-related protein n=1 Tax=Rhodococcus sp. DMU1 TaxID=2722825 RepID=UPI00143E3EBA|nr:enoyl-CoA hydratase-related protein [Rhodococcus sp. DMU1]QIX53745.1 enoyl-CoA hydratase [Rhodococcus sp. DMU1]
MSELLVQGLPDGVEVWTLNRPDARNALTSTLAEKIVTEIDRAAADSAVHAVVLIGAGKGFCAGLDLAEFSKPDAPRGVVGDAIRRAHCFPKPLVGAINGPAVTGGLELALACDILVASPDAVFRDTHLRIGAMSGSGLTVHLPRAVGKSWARRMILANDPLPADIALRVGLVTEVVPAESLLDHAIALASRIGGMDPTLASTVKQLCVHIDRVPPAEGLQLEAAALREHRKKGRAWKTAT